MELCSCLSLVSLTRGTKQSEDPYDHAYKNNVSPNYLQCETL